MKKSMMHRTVAFALSLLLMCPMAGVNAIAASPASPVSDGQTVLASDMTVAFDQDYAKIGEPLKAVVAGLPVDTDCTYQWTVDNIKVGSNTDSYTPVQEDLEKTIKVVVSAPGFSNKQAATYCSKLPVVYINTENDAPIVSKDYYLNAVFKLQGNDQYNADTTTLYDGKIEIKGRGNTSWQGAKKPYKLKLDASTNLFGMGKNKHWVLLANYTDRSLLRNTLAYDLSGELGMPQMQTAWVNVILNGEFIGNYQLCEQIRVSPDRVDVFDWKSAAEDAAKAIQKANSELNKEQRDELATQMEENMAWITSGSVTYKGNGKTYSVSEVYEIPSINGGYLMELDEYWDEISKFKTKKNQPINFNTPEFVNTNPEMMKFVQGYIQAFEDAAFAEDGYVSYNGKSMHYSELFDMDALVDYWLISEIFFNEDANKKSTYMYKEIDSLYKMGPIWDMDWSSGSGQGQTSLTNQWWSKFYATNAQANMWYKPLIQDPVFVMKAQARYWDIRDLVENIIKEDGIIEQSYEFLKESAAVNVKRWGYNSTFRADVDVLKNWMITHVSWIDEQFKTQESALASLSSKTQDQSIILAMTDTQGNKLAPDSISSKAPANGMVTLGNNITVKATVTNPNMKKVAFYANGIKLDTVAVTSNTASITVSADKLVGLDGAKSTMTVKGLSETNTMIGSNYITVVEKADNDVVTSLKITPPEKTEYFEGDELNLTGMVVTAVTAGGIETEVTDLVEVSGYTATAGTKVITVSYLDVIGTFEVTVSAIELSGIQITPPVRLSYMEGEELDTTGLIVTAVYNNGTKVVVSDYTIDGYSSTPGVKTVMVHYGGFAATFEVTVNSKSCNKNVLAYVIERAQEHVDNKDVDKLIPTVRARYLNALADANRVYGDVDATQEQVDSAWVQLIHIMQYLEFKPGDKDSLIILERTAGAIDLDEYQDCDIKTVFINALADARGVIADADAMKDEVDTTYEALKKALEDLETLVPKKADKTNLKTVLNIAGGYYVNIEKYINGAAKDNFLAIYEKAQQVFDNPKATQAEVDAVTMELVEAMSKLRLKVNKEALDDLIEKMKDVNLSGYTAASVAQFKEALAQAEAVAAQDMSIDQQAEIEASIIALQNAYANLIPQTTAANPGNNPVGSAATADNAPILALGILAMVSAGAVLFCRKKKQQK